MFYITLIYIPPKYGVWSIYNAFPPTAFPLGACMTFALLAGSSLNV